MLLCSILLAAAAYMHTWQESSRRERLQSCSNIYRTVWQRQCLGYQGGCPTQYQRVSKCRVATLPTPSTLQGAWGAHAAIGVFGAPTLAEAFGGFSDTPAPADTGTPAFASSPGGTWGTPYSITPEYYHSISAMPAYEVGGACWEWHRWRNQMFCMQ